MRRLQTILALGFRPFFLLGGLFALVLIPLWLLVYSGVLPPAFTGWQNPIYWHAHEMIFGFAVAVVAGFLATATQNWTGIPGISGAKLGVLVLFWGLARLMSYAGLGGTWVYAVIDLAFVPLFAFFISKYLMAPGQRRNWILYGIFLMLFLGNAAVHMEALGIYEGYAQEGLILGLNALTAVVVLIGGRVIPFFTRSATGASVTIRPRIEQAAYATIILFAVVEALTDYHAAISAAAVLAGVVHAVRWSGWGWKSTLKVPVLWVLHIGYLFVIAGFFLTALQQYLPIQGAAATHAFAVGGLGIVIFGMITRVSLGHTGRPIKPPRSIEIAYGLLVAAAVVRVGGAFTGGAYYLASVVAAGTLWTMAFAIFVKVYLPILTSPRADGRAG